MYVYVSAMHARERRNVSDIASLALLAGEASKFSTVTQAVSPLAGGNSEDEGKPCCENAIAHETDRKSEPACWRAATGSLMNSYSMEASKILRSTVLTSLASQTLSMRVWLARLEVLTSLFW